ncbi:hypothetical protein [Aquimarina algiphila]|uniref:hypothetical protein n=1 Tax=Aquimarina algiphila TaxID=2047982 RepID=UPI00232E4A03|nr:hypothetical protein [Aquimarina algiphila]
MKICLKKNGNTALTALYANIPDLISAIKVLKSFGTVANPISINPFIDKEAAVPIPSLKGNETLSIEIIPTNDPQLYSPKIIFIEIKNMDEQFNVNYCNGTNNETKWSDIIDVGNYIPAPNASLFIKSSSNDEYKIKFKKEKEATFISYNLVFSLELPIEDNKPLQKCVFILDPLIKIVSNPGSVNKK